MAALYSLEHPNKYKTEKTSNLMGIYETMSDDWNAYSLMSGIALIEEMSKPSKTYKTVFSDKTVTYQNFRAIRLKV